MPQVSALASCASRADTPMVPMPVRLAFPVSRSLMMFCTSAGGVQSLRENASGTGNCSGLYMSQYLPGGLNGWCGSGNDTIRKNGSSSLVLVEIGAGAVAEERGGVKLLRDRGAIGLRHRVVVRQAVLRPEQRPAPSDRAHRASGRSRRPARRHARGPASHDRSRRTACAPARPAWSSSAGVSCSYFGSVRWSRSDCVRPADGSWKPVARRRPLDDRIPVA